MSTNLKSFLQAVAGKVETQYMQWLCYLTYSSQEFTSFTIFFHINQQNGNVVIVMSDESIRSKPFDWYMCNSDILLHTMAQHLGEKMACLVFPSSVNLKSATIQIHLTGEFHVNNIISVGVGER